MPGVWGGLHSAVDYDKSTTNDDNQRLYYKIRYLPKSFTKELTPNLQRYFLEH